MQQTQPSAGTLALCSSLRLGVFPRPVLGNLDLKGQHPVSKPFTRKLPPLPHKSAGGGEPLVFQGRSSFSCAVSLPPSLAKILRSSDLEHREAQKRSQCSLVSCVAQDRAILGRKRKQKCSDEACWKNSDSLPLEGAVCESHGCGNGSLFKTEYTAEDSVGEPF